MNRWLYLLAFEGVIFGYSSILAFLFDLIPFILFNRFLFFALIIHLFIIVQAYRIEKKELKESADI